MINTISQTGMNLLEGHMSFMHSQYKYNILEIYKTTISKNY